MSTGDRTDKQSAERVEADVEGTVMRPIAQVFAAIVDPAQMKHYFISGASGPMKALSTVEWEFADVKTKLSVEVKELEPNKIVFDWSASGTKARVTIALSEAKGSTKIAIREAAWPFDTAGVKAALAQTQGWTDFLCCLKAYLQHGINLRTGQPVASAP